MLVCAITHITLLTSVAAGWRQLDRREVRYGHRLPGLRGGSRPALGLSPPWRTGAGSVPTSEDVLGNPAAKVVDLLREVGRTDPPDDPPGEGNEKQEINEAQ